MCFYVYHGVPSVESIKLTTNIEAKMEHNGRKWNTTEENGTQRKKVKMRNILLKYLR